MSRLSLPKKAFILDLTAFALCLLFLGAINYKSFVKSLSAEIEKEWVEISNTNGEKPQIKNINVLVMGVDSVEGTHRSDTIFVLGVNPSKAHIHMLSIPRDTRVIIKERARKINEILPRHGQRVLCSLLEDLLNIKIDRYVSVDFKAFTEVIDSIGGVDINIEKAMNYDDNYGNLHIHFKKGPTHLNGVNALNYVRFRGGALADLGRIKRQQHFVKAVIEKLISPSGLLKLPQIIETGFKHTKTDFSTAEILAVINGFSTGKISFDNTSLPGEARYIGKVSYFIPYKDKAAMLGAAYFTDLASIELSASFSTDISNAKDASESYLSNASLNQAASAKPSTGKAISESHLSNASSNQAAPAKPNTGKAVSEGHLSGASLNKAAPAKPNTGKSVSEGHLSGASSNQAAPAKPNTGKSTSATALSESKLKAPPSTPATALLEPKHKAIANASPALKFK